MSELGLSLWHGEIWLPERRQTPGEIIRHVARKHGLTVDEMCSGRRFRKIARAKQEAMWELRQKTSLSYPGIARRLNLLDHTSVMHGEKRHAERLEAAE